MDDTAIRERVGRVESLLEAIELLPDRAARETAGDMAQALLDLYGEGLARIVDHVAERDDGTLAESLASDELVSHLLLLHGLHPVPLEERVRGALEEVRPYLVSHGGNVELVAVDGGVARLRMEGSCSGCPSSAVTLKLAIETAVRKAAPDLEEIEALEAPAPAAPIGLIPLQMAATAPMRGDPPPRTAAAATSPPPGLLQIELSDAARARSPHERAAPDEGWVMVGGLRDLDGAPLVKRIAGQSVLFLRLDSGIYAYRPACPRCGTSLAGATLDGARLSCGGCGTAYDGRRAGRSDDVDGAHLEPVPLLVDRDGLVRVALGATG